MWNMGSSCQLKIIREIQTEHRRVIFKIYTWSFVSDIQISFVTKRLSNINTHGVCLSCWRLYRYISRKLRSNFEWCWSNKFKPWVNDVWRGVRSTLHFSPKNLRIQKWSHSGKNGSKHPMLSISMADNVISYKKIKRDAQKNKIADFTV